MIRLNIKVKCARCRNQHMESDREDRLRQILFRYEAPALADAANGALRRDAEH